MRRTKGISPTCIVHTIQNEHFSCSFCISPILRFIHHSVYIAWFWTRDTLPCHITCHVQTLLKYGFDTLDPLDTVKSKTLLHGEITSVASWYISHVHNTYHIYESHVGCKDASYKRHITHVHTLLDFGHRARYGVNKRVTYKPYWNIGLTRSTRWTR